MHVLQWIAVEADDKDEAYRRVEDSLCLLYTSDAADE